MRYTAAEYAKALYAALRESGEAEADKAVKRFVKDMKAKGQLALLPQVLKELPQAMRETEGIEEVLIESAHGIDDDIRAAALAALGKRPEEVEVTERLNPDLMGGIRVRGKDTLVDATLKGRLKRLREAFAKPVNVEQ